MGVTDMDATAATPTPANDTAAVTEAVSKVTSALKKSTTTVAADIQATPVTEPDVTAGTPTQSKGTAAVTEAVIEATSALKKSAKKSETTAAMLVAKDSDIHDGDATVATSVKTEPTSIKGNKMEKMLEKQAEEIDALKEALEKQ